MTKKRDKKSLIDKGGKGGKVEKIKNEDKVEKVKKEDKVEKVKKEDKVEKVKKEENSVDKLLEKITTDTVTDAMVEHKWLVAKTITAHIIGVRVWDKLSEENQYIIIKRINEIKLKIPRLM